MHILLPSVNACIRDLISRMDGLEIRTGPCQELLAIKQSITLWQKSIVCVGAIDHSGGSIRNELSSCLA